MVGLSGGTRQRGNTQLVDYGIFQEGSDIRIHVSPLDKKLYIYKTKAMVDLVERNVYPEKPAYTEGIMTGWGFIVPVSDIPDLQTIAIPQHHLDRFPISNYLNTSNKGKNAVQIVKVMLADKLIPLQLDIYEINDKTLQIRGLDVVVKAEIKIQVKCDIPASLTGNLFVQTKECNPYGMV